MPTSNIVPALAGVAARVAGRGRRPATDRVYFLVVTIDGVSGVPRTVLTLASALADRHDVEIISVYRRHDKPNFDVDPRVRISYLYDQRRRGRRRKQGWARARAAPRRSRLKARLDRSPSRFFPKEKELSRLTDLLLARRLLTLQPGVLISVRPALHAIAAAVAPPHLVTVAQDHLNFPTRMSGPAVRGLMERVTRRLDCLSALTAADAVDYRAAFPDARALITSIPNAASWSPVEEPPPLDAKIVVSGGRLERRKGFHRLIHAYAPVAHKHPDWQLHIYGKGREEARLRKLIRKLGVEEQVVLKGFTADFGAALSGSSVYAMASVYEGFPMVLLEAMSRGLPLVSYDCPRGPGEIIDDGRNGRLVADGDKDMLTAALLQVIEDDEARRRMGAQALADVAGYGVQAIAGRWEALFDELLARRAARR
ncbi:MAG TPA: glycosyltransferase family 4 protein [Nocardioidaceae bacterium]|nr:glycosyltransferase family 4 protein [Nocardioidaceae bacterium]